MLILIFLLLLIDILIGLGYYFGLRKKPQTTFLRVAVVLLWPFAGAFMATEEGRLLADGNKPDGSPDSGCTHT